MGGTTEARGQTRGAVPFNGGRGAFLEEREKSGEGRETREGGGGGGGGGRAEGTKASHREQLPCWNKINTIILHMYYFYHVWLYTCKPAYMNVLLMGPQR